MKLYIQKDLNDPSKLRLEHRSHPDSNTICPAPEGEEVEWLDLVSEPNPLTGEDGPLEAVVNETRKAQVLADRQAAKDANAWLAGRLAEYPSQMDLMEALIEAQEGRPEKLAEVSAARAAVKAKYPKPE